jgi:hypothetical protein
VEKRWKGVSSDRCSDSSTAYVPFICSRRKEGKVTDNGHVAAPDSTAFTLPRLHERKGWDGKMVLRLRLCTHPNSTHQLPNSQTIIHPILPSSQEPNVSKRRTDARSSLPAASHGNEGVWYNQVRIERGIYFMVLNYKDPGFRVRLLGAWTPRSHI